MKTGLASQTPAGAGRAIHQLLAGYVPGDAISNVARGLRALFRSWGYASEIYCASRHIAPALRQDGRDAAQLAAAVAPGDVVLLQLSIGSDVNDLFPTLPCRRAIMYQNITPAEFFRGFNEAMAAELNRGRQQLAALAGAAAVVLAVSRYNAAELEALGYPDVRVLPLLLDFDQLRGRPDRAVLRRFRDGTVNILCVGRCAPNKRLEDALSAFYYFQRYVEPRSRLLLVGSYAGLDRYQLLLRLQARELGLRQVVFPGAVPQAALNACYAAADLLLCLSEHEGFCIPLLESMARDVPVLAYAAGAIPETLAGAGVLFRAKRWDLVSEMMGALVHNTELRQAVLAGQRARLAAYERRDLAGELRAALEPLLSD